MNQIDPKLLRPHPRNEKIYGQDDHTELMEQITRSGWIKPLVVTSSNTIISGHRRWHVALELGRDSIDVEYRDYPDETAELEALLLENAYRHKTYEQKVREADIWQEIERERARQRQSEAVSRRHAEERDPVAVENFPPLETGKTRDRVADRVGFGSGKSYENAAKVVKVIDQAEAAGDIVAADTLRRVLNEQSIDAAKKLITRPERERAAIIDKLATGEARTLKDAIGAVAREERINKIVEISAKNKPLENSIGQFPVIYCDPPWRYEFCSDPADEIENHYPTMTLEAICAIRVGDITTSDAILFMWATSPKLGEAFKVIEAWGFSYRTCAVWDKEWIAMGYYFRQQHELLLIATKGDIPAPRTDVRPPSIVRARRTEHSAKPAEFYSIIERMYPELPKLEMFARQQRAGWYSWGNQSEVA